MNKEFYMFASVAFLFISFIIVLNSAQALTGYVVLEGVSWQSSYFVGIWFFLVGLTFLILYVIARKKQQPVRRKRR